MDTPLGSPLRRKEDQRLITGRGRYVEDLRFPGMLHAAFVRSPYAHARVRSIDTAAARAMAGVVAVYTARDLPECARPIPPSMRGPRRLPADRAAGLRRPARALRGRGGGRGGRRGCLRGRGRGGGGAWWTTSPCPPRAPWSARSSRARRGCSTAGPTTWPASPPPAWAIPRPASRAPTSWWRRGSASARVHGVPIETRGIVATPAGPDGRFTLWTSSQSPYGLRGVHRGRLRARRGAACAWWWWTPAAASASRATPTPRI